MLLTLRLKKLRWAGHVAYMGEKRNACTILVGIPGGKEPLGTPRHRWQDNVKMDLREIGWEVLNMDSFGLG
jgi:hypothetical protein